ncbi:hypothetical protein AB1L30_01620 [Bremerella sp. JC817]|uniref:hypothetical protein n=1 Tax=Bremerella sp. JC817 TaxID=3231756 RepID=UPI00345AE8E3
MEPFEGGPGEDGSLDPDQEPRKQPHWYAWLPVGVGICVVLMIAGLIAFSSIIPGVRWGIILLLTPVLLLNLWWLVVYSRRIHTPAGRMISGLASLGVAAGMFGLVVMAFVIAFFYCASQYQSL